MAMNLSQGLALTLPPLPIDLDILYTPDVLLPVPFHASVVSRPDFEQACSQGFECWFEGLIDEDENGEEIFVRRGYSWDEIVSWVIEAVAVELSVLVHPSAWKAGFCLGWLSALALFQLEDAQRAIVVLLALLGPAAVTNG